MFLFLTFHYRWNTKRLMRKYAVRDWRVTPWPVPLTGEYHDWQAHK